MSSPTDEENFFSWTDQDSIYSIVFHRTYVYRKFSYTFASTADGDPVMIQNTLNSRRAKWGVETKTVNTIPGPPSIAAASFAGLQPHIEDYLTNSIEGVAIPPRARNSDIE
jgi:hypothetical protein